MVIDTSSSYFTVSFEMTITSLRVFQINGNGYVFGQPGQVHHWSVNGKLTQQGPPSAHIAGFASGSRAAPVSVD